MKFSAILLFLFMPFFASAANVRCTLKSGPDSHAQSVELRPDQETSAFSTEGSVKDLSFDLISTCEKSACHVEVTFYSQKIEDEVGNMSWPIDAQTSQAGEFFADKIENAPDHEDYQFACELNKP